MAEPSPHQCREQLERTDGLRYWCISFDGHSGRCFWDVAPGQEPPPLPDSVYRKPLTLL